VWLKAPSNSHANLTNLYGGLQHQHGMLPFPHSSNIARASIHHDTLAGQNVESKALQVFPEQTATTALSQASSGPMATALISSGNCKAKCHLLARS